MFSRIFTIARKEMIHVRRDKRLIMAIIAMPLIQLLLFSYALSFDVKNISMVVMDRDATVQSRRLVSAFTNSGYFRIEDRIKKEGEIDSALDSGKAKVALVIPSGFARRTAAAKKVSVQVLIDGSESNAAVIARNYANGIIQQFSQNLSLDAVGRKGVNIGKAAILPLEPRSRLWYNPSGNSTIFILPGLIVVIMMQLAVMQTSMAVVREKDHGTIEQLIVSPINSYELMVGKIIPFFVLAFIDLAVVMGIGVFAFGMPVHGSLLLLLLGAVLFTLAGLGLGLVVSSVAGTMETASQLSLLIAMLPAFLLSGFVWPIENMPLALQGVTYLFPARYFVTMLRGLFLKGAGVDILWPQLLALSIFAVASIGLAALNFKERSG
jgi:ABC-2 type transport system permease protein